MRVNMLSEAYSHGLKKHKSGNILSFFEMKSSLIDLLQGYLAHTANPPRTTIAP